MSKHNYTTLQILVLLLLSFHAYGDSLNCLKTIGSTYYDLSGLQSSTDYTLDIDPTNNIYLEFNVCRFMVNSCHNKLAFASLYQKDVVDTAGTKCLSTTATTKYNYITTELLNAASKSDGIRMLFENGDKISQAINEKYYPLATPAEIADAANADATYSFQINFRCNNSAESPWIEKWSYVNKNFTLIVDFHSKSPCAAFTIDQLTGFVGDHPIPFCIVGAVLGLAIMILGLKLFLPTLALFGFGAGFLVTIFTFFSTVVTPDSRESTKWILLAFCIIFGLAIAYIVVIVNKLGLFLMGAWFGFIIALILYNAVLYKINSNPADLVLLLSCGIGALLFGILALIFYKHVVIISTSLVGSYLLVRSLSLVIGSFPSEIELVNQIQTQNYAFTVEWPFYVYMNVILALTIIAIIIQYKIKKRTEKKVEEFDDDAEFQKLDI